MDGEPGSVERAIRALADAGDLDGAITRAIEAYGDELLGFLLGLTGDRDRADDLFSEMCERAWRNLERFRWESTLRVWMYAIARNAFFTGVTRDRRHVPLSGAPSVQAAAQRVRSATPPYQRTDVKDRFARVRERLDPEDHMLLGLRIDRGLEWSEIAGILDKDAATLRKRFERLKAELRKKMSAR